MIKRISAMLTVIIMLVCFALSASAADASIFYESSFDSGKNVVSVTVYIENATGLEAADLNLAYDTAMYEFVDAVEADVSDEAMVVAGKAATDDGLVTCSIMFMEACVAADLDENGRLQVATFNFSPKKADYDTENFCYWASSYSVSNVNIADEINIVGKQDLMEDRTDAVTYNRTTDNAVDTTKSSTAGISGDLGSKWYVYVIAGVLAVGAIAGIAVVAIRSSHNEDEEEAEGGKENKKKEKTAEDSVDADDKEDEKTDKESENNEE